MESCGRFEKERGRSEQGEKGENGGEEAPFISTNQAWHKGKGTSLCQAGRLKTSA